MLKFEQAVVVRCWFILPIISSHTCKEDVPHLDAATARNAIA